ncbi:uncharacterized protein LOC127812261 [Diospyros lotus]|uniref:uncharacterized protein LOC127812261 n=1 Tax=Diospyros lotus TaxID=55363 RepID=UPI002255217A|nr:uncharacterized protein LOC127812261 [Diospyros lotus]
MADFQAPSFSLGLDFDLDSEPQTAPAKNPSSPQQPPPSSIGRSFLPVEDDDVVLYTPTRGQDEPDPDPPRTLKRIRRGLASDPASAARSREPAEPWRDVGDEIEEFSSQEDRRRVNEHSSKYCHTGCSSSKIPLHAHGVLTMQSVSQDKLTKRKKASNTPASASLESWETSGNKVMFPKLTLSPLRRFQLLSDSDSDSDDPSVSEDTSREANVEYSSLKEKEYTTNQHPATRGQERAKASVSVSRTEDLWKDFHTEKDFRIPTPALDEVCEEYFRFVNDKEVTPSLGYVKRTNEQKDSFQNGVVLNNDENLCKLGDSIPPVHRYFFHDDPRIQNLVRSRLPYFFPLGATYNRGNERPISSAIDYMSQFSNGEGSKPRATAKINAEINSTSGRKNSRKVNAEEVSKGSGSWVNPKSSVGIPKDAAKRRVQAVGRSAGHWFTTPDGKRVYVNKNGQELGGQIAYRHYRKETGAGFEKSRKRSAGKKKTKPKSKSKPAAGKKRKS